MSKMYWDYIYSVSPSVLLRCLAPTLPSQVGVLFHFSLSYSSFAFFSSSFPIESIKFSLCRFSLIGAEAACSEPHYWRRLPPPVANNWHYFLKQEWGIKTLSLSLMEYLLSWSCEGHKPATTVFSSWLQWPCPLQRLYLTAIWLNLYLFSIFLLKWFLYKLL